MTFPSSRLEVETSFRALVSATRSGFQVAEPDALIGMQDNISGHHIQRLPADQVDPVFRVDKIDLAQGDALDLVGDVVQSKNTLLTIQALAPECKNGIAQMESELSGIGMKRGLLAAGRDQCFQVIQYSRMAAVQIKQTVLQGLCIPAVSVDMSLVAAGFQAFVVIACCQQAVNVKCRNTFQRR